MSKTPIKPLVPPPSIAELKKLRIPLRNVNKTVAAEVSTLDRLALWITRHVGTMGFFIVIFIWTVLWLGWNLLAPKELQFDPPSAFVFWLFISNLVQIMLMPLIMVGQNIQGREADEVILRHLEYQNAILIAMMENRDVGTNGKPPRTKK